MSSTQTVDAIEKEVSSYLGMIGGFIIHTQLKKLHRNKDCLNNSEMTEFIGLVMSEVARLTGPTKAKEIEQRLKDLSSGAFVNSLNADTESPFFPNNTF